MDPWTEFKELKSLAKLDELADSLAYAEKKKLYQTVLDIASQVEREGKISGAGGIRVDEYLKEQLSELKARAKSDYD